jgi:hypothetical protein
MHGYRIDSIEQDETVSSSGLIYDTESQAEDAANDHINNG